MRHYVFDVLLGALFCKCSQNPQIAGLVAHQRLVHSSSLKDVFDTRFYVLSDGAYRFFANFKLGEHEIGVQP